LDGLLGLSSLASIDAQTRVTRKLSFSHSLTLALSLDELELELVLEIIVFIETRVLDIVANTAPTSSMSFGRAFKQQSKPLIDISKSFEFPPMPPEGLKLWSTESLAPGRFGTRLLNALTRRLRRGKKVRKRIEWVVV